MTGPWSWQPPQAKLMLGSFSGCFDTSQPSSGIHQLRLGQIGLEGTLLGVSIPPTDSPQEWARTRVLDIYVRDDDLVAKYPESPSRPYRTEICWTARSDSPRSEVIAVLSLRVSIETDLLVSQPEVQLCTQLPASEIIVLESEDGSNWSEVPVQASEERTADSMGGTPMCLLYRFEKIGLSYVEMTHQSDLQNLAIRRQGPNNWVSRWKVFGQHLEKGVIRRARTQGLWVNSAQDVQAATKSYQTFAESALPLSA